MTLVWEVIDFLVDLRTTIKLCSLLVTLCVCVSDGSLAAGDAVAAEKTKVESVELVLPPHANHQVSGSHALFPMMIQFSPN